MSPTTVQSTSHYAHPIPLHQNLLHDHSLDSDPVAAMMSYSKTMFVHTKQQMDDAAQAARRGSVDAVDSNGNVSDMQQQQQQHRDLDHRDGQ